MKIGNTDNQVLIGPFFGAESNGIKISSNQS